jgi:DNA-binding NarL/FixJ family response regulator
MISIVVICERKEDQSRIVKMLSPYEDLRVVRSGKDEYDALALAENVHPDIIIMDMRVTSISMAELAAIIKRKSPLTTLIVLGSRDDEDYADTAIKAGISGYLLKEVDMELLANSVRIVSQGCCCVSGPIIKRAFNTVPNRLPGPRPGGRNFISPDFSPVERRILDGIARGYSDVEIAQNLHISVGTVRNYLSRVRHRTGSRNRTQIIIQALLCGLLPLPLRLSQNFSFRRTIA